MRTTTVVLRALVLSLPIVLAAAVGVRAQGPAAGATPQMAVTDALNALGLVRGAQRIDMLTTLQFWGTGTGYDVVPAASRAWPSFTISSYKGSLGFAYDKRFEPGMRVEMERTAAPGGPARKSIQVVVGDRAWDEDIPGGGAVAGYGTATPAMASAADRLLQFWILPHSAIKAAAQAGAGVTVTQDGEKRILSFALPSPLDTTMVKVTLDSQHLPERVEAATTHSVLGTTVIEASYGSYADLGRALGLQADVMFPGRIVQKLGGRTLLDLTVTKVNAYNPYVVFPLPPVVASATAGRAPR